MTPAKGASSSCMPRGNAFMRRPNFFAVEA
jgi:hypothetical protein